ncbi:glycosyltransferase family 4 protein [Azospirillum sp. TSO22-1]|uniref:glycosyltransferase family 4 protein n=1 Tax=Azospirillum sp. TSO22-1 TaxID=716789 RepID=UPI000D65AEC8|nr:glycosyltransferase family 4 protein [Azospirillum sp. TSO22-1]
MNILLINHYAGSDRLGMEYRPFYLAREWVAAGHRVTIVGASHSHLRARQPEPTHDLATDVEEGVRYRWLRTRPYSGNGLGRVANMAAFVAKLWAYAPRLAREERPDVVICSSTYPLDIYPGARIARRAGARLVFEVHDLWPLTPMLLGGYSPGHPFIRAMQAAEDYACRHVDTLVSILPHTRDYLVGRGLDPAKFVHIPNGIPAAAFRNAPAGELPPDLASRIAAERARGHFLVGYAGGINPSDPLETILDAAIRLKDKPVSFIFVGGGSAEREFKARIAAAALPNVHHMGVIPKVLVQTFLAEMDALTMSWKRSPLYAYGVSPNKVFDYMLAGRPIVQACEAGNDLVGEGRCGFTVPPEDTQAFADALLRLSGMAPEERARLGGNGRRFVLEHHDYRVLAARFAAVTAPPVLADPAHTLARRTAVADAHG